ncbi:hypothetical protein VFPPC_18054 [Pochonia chlamydosporia 170]|uniref:Uncharacterized protein n=1 Tax=Pochonia chlamydosporia 170 TaxID=1380566 RepID=A0A219AQ97_METCM|nr:hypothetical protein VFPPC_18054 [Pochonia chlamydosporia 170]OWT42799.1 hypothetical protein VFPPC_18054 [Pochonia chlamydosporia 170]
MNRMALREMGVPEWRRTTAKEKALPRHFGLVLGGLTSSNLGKRCSQLQSKLEDIRRTVSHGHRSPLKLVQPNGLGRIGPGSHFLMAGWQVE